MAEEKKGFFKRLVSGLTKTRDNIVKGFDSLLRGAGGDPDHGRYWDQCHYSYS